MAIHDHNWQVEERDAKEGRQFVLMGGKGQIFAFPTAHLNAPDEFYSREDALANASLAANAPRLLRFLELIARRLHVLGVDDPLLVKWAKEIEAEIADVQNFAVRLR